MNKKFSKLMLTSASALALLAAYPSVASTAEVVGLDLPAITAEAATQGNAFIRVVRALPSANNIKTSDAPSVRAARNLYNSLPAAEKANAGVARWAGYLAEKEAALPVDHVANFLIESRVLPNVAEINAMNATDFAKAKSDLQAARFSYSNLTAAQKADANVARWAGYLTVKEDAFGVTFILAAKDLPTVGAIEAMDADELAALAEDIASVQELFTALSPTAKADAEVARWMGYVNQKAEAAEVVEDEELVVESVSAINSTTVEVKFNKAVSDAAVLKLTRDGGAVVNVAETNFSEDRKTVQLVLPNKFVAGDYTVKLTDGEATSEETVKLADEKVADIKIASDVAIANTNASPTALKVAYQVLNQYGEDVTADYTVAPTSSQGTAAVNTNGTIDITGTTFTLDSNVSVTLLHAETGTFASKTVKVSSAAKPATYEMKGLYNADGKTPRAGDSTTGYSVLFKAKDQYGNDLKPSELGVAGTDYVLNSSNTSVAGLGSVAGSYKKIDGVDYLEVPLTGGTFGQGTTVFNLISTTSGKSVSSTLEVPAALAVSKITLGAPDFAVGGEKFNLPFTALDQDGNAVTDLGKLNAVNFTVSNSSISNSAINFKKDYVTGEIYLEVDATGDNGLAQNKTINIIATTTNGAVAQRSVNLRVDAYAASIAGIKNVEKNLVATQVQKLKSANFIFKDQYGRDMAVAPTLGTSPGQYQVDVKSSDTSVVVSTNPLTSASGEVTLTAAAAKGSANITATLNKVDSSSVAKPVPNSSYRYTANVVEGLDIAKLELGTLGVLNDVSTTAVGGADAGFADQDLVIYGVDASGNKTIIPTADITITSTVLDYTGATGKLAVKATAAVPYASSTVNVADVSFIASAYGKTLNGTVKVSRESEVITTVVADKDAAFNANYKKLTDTSVSVDSTVVTNDATVLSKVVNALEVTDQYGADITPAFTAADIVLSNFKGADGKAVANHTLANVAGGSYTVTVLLPNGKTVAIDVIVGA